MLITGLFLTVSGHLNAAEPLPDLSVYTKGFQQQEGLLDVYYDVESGSVYLAIARQSPQYLFQSSLPHGVGSNDIGLDRGQLGETRLVQFEQFGKKLLLKQINTQFRASAANPAERASVEEAFASAVIAGLPIVAANDKQWLVDYTEFLLSDIHGVGKRLRDKKQGSFSLDRQRSGVYLSRTKAFEQNTELEALVTFGGEGTGEYLKQVSPTSDSLSVHLHHSFIQLPDDDYKPRVFHPYSGFWSIDYEDYSQPIYAEKTQRLIPRHRLIKKDPSAAMSEPIEPIIYYLDPGIPEPIKSALKEGALWWNDGFERLGFENAFQVQELPLGADPMDVRYNVIQWVHRATRGWSYGSSVIDPRTGEIIKGHVTLGSLRVRQDFLIALGLTSPFTENQSDNRLGELTQSQQAMALSRIKQLAAHEVGHTLGIAHNFAASENGRASVMDYPHPMLSVKKGRVDLSEAYATGLGEWDFHVIEYGYRHFASLEQEKNELQSIIDRTKSAGLRYLSDPDARPSHAVSVQGHLWDNGDDTIEELKNLSEVRALALAQFGKSSLPYGLPFSELEERLAPIYLLHRYQVEAVAKLIGGYEYSYEINKPEEAPVGLSPVSMQMQLKALDILLQTVSVNYLSLPEALITLIPPKSYGYRRNRESFQGRNGLLFDPISAAESAAAHTLRFILQPERLNRLHQISHQQQWKAFSLKGVVQSVINRVVNNDVTKTQKGTFAELLNNRLKFVALFSLINVADSSVLAPEARAEIHQELRVLRKALYRDKNSAVSQEMAFSLQKYLEEGSRKEYFLPKTLPPGSPI
ncbi:periplasmic metalloprotease [Marinibactrum halimedae]|uniref:Periplasmic metalloprotease n=2 Tax=Marinibactrum halimedae TaxID=1444977 RepID=A0AA37WML0_9GAMM|nr:periplasmic metalloprotease [Marinibactrum halimedae]